MSQDKEPSHCNRGISHQVDHPYFCSRLYDPVASTCVGRTREVPAAIHILGRIALVFRAVADPSRRGGVTTTNIADQVRVFCSARHVTIVQKN
ncbi:hypothetical protein PQR46_39600 [Paraburkholderia sediminicola]|uniref:hypothetical protein n=1 Tax=Paraburkholderia sediminicola TaxID=458836 RepID=UPI0038BC8032